MRTLLTLVTVVLLALVVSGCQSDGAKLLEHYEKMAEIVSANKDDCPAMREELDTYLDAHGEEIEDIWSKGEDMTGTDEESEKLAYLIIEVAHGAQGCGIESPVFGKRLDGTE